MPRRRVLVVKLSSLGDTLHALPAVAEIAARLDAEVDWAVQPAFASLVVAPRLAASMMMSSSMSRSFTFWPAMDWMTKTSSPRTDSSKRA